MKITTGAAIHEPGNSLQNKTGSWRTFKPVLEQLRCIKCQLCTIYCPDSSISFDEEISIDYDYCKGCGICAFECPTRAIEMVREEK